VGVPVRLAEPATAAILRTGDHVDLLAVPSSGSPTAVGTDAVVLGLGAPSTGGSPGRDQAPDSGEAVASSAGVIVLALTPAEATRTVGLALDTHLAVIVRP
jgi:hypothetical protein